MQEATPLPDIQQWMAATAPNWTWDWPHQLLIYRELERLTRGETTRLMIFLPPRHAKSETVTVRYTAYRLAIDPTLNIIIGSYNQKLANRFSRKVRAIAREHLPLSRERNAAEEWETAAGGGLRAAGSGAGVTGFGAGLIVIDDPVKNRAEAESDAVRERTWDWFNDDIYTRLEPAGVVVLIQTRWHEDDLAGRLLREMAEGGESWVVISLPALAEENDPLGRAEGEALCPARFSRDALLRISRRLGSYSFAALYQQRPMPAGGGLFKREWFRSFVRREPEGLQWARGYDLAASTRTSADHTASFRCAFDAEGRLYIAGGMRRRMEYPEQRRYVIGRMRAEPSTRHAVEKALHGLAFAQDIRRLASLRHVPLEAVGVDADKFTRALAWAALAEEGKVVLVRGDWNEEFLDEVCRFTGRGDRSDDQVDAVSLAVRVLSHRRRRLHTF
jgi:predicted phage terminase large subunit-like protein